MSNFPVIYIGGFIVLIAIVIALYFLAGRIPSVAEHRSKRAEQVAERRRQRAQRRAS